MDREESREYACSVFASMRVVRGKWKPLLLALIGEGRNRFGALRRAVPEIAPQVLTVQLRALERDDLVARTDRSGKTLHVEYALTERGAGLLPALDALRRWGRGW
jgi:DNA-binding HxlR family transcriptional regulator